MSIAETVQEIIDGEEVDRQDIADVANEIAAMVVLNQALNNALWIASDKLGQANAARDKAIAFMHSRRREWQWDIIKIVELMTTGGTHRDKDEAQLQAIKLLMALIQNTSWDVNKIAGFARGEITESRDENEIPF